MRFDELRLLAFGPFTDLTLDLSAAHGRLCVIHGANEAGKSTTLRAISSFLFGIHHQSTDNFLHPHTEMRIGATLSGDGDEVLSCTRLKRRKHPLRDADDQPMEEAVLKRLMPGLDAEAFIRRFGIDHVRLREGGDGLLQAGGELGETLFSAGAGLGGVRALLNSLDAEADALWLPRGRNQVIPDLLRAFKGHRDTEEEATTSSSEWAELARQQRGLEETRVQERATLAELRASLAHNARLRQALPLVAERRELDARRATVMRTEAIIPEVPDAEPIPPRRLPSRYDPSERAELSVALTTGAARLEKLTIERARLAKELAGLEVPDGWVEHRQAILELAHRLPGYQKAKSDLRSLWGRMKQAEALARDRFEQVRAGLDAEGAEHLRPTAAGKARLLALSREHQTVTEAPLETRRRLEALEAQITVTEAALSRLGEAVDPRGLEAAVAAAREDGPLHRQIVEIEAEQAEVEARVGRLLRRLPLVERVAQHEAVSALEAATLPAPETVERYERAFGELAEKGRTLARQRGEADAALQSADSALATLSRAGAPPSEAELEAAREARAVMWREVKAQVLNPGEAGSASTEPPEVLVDRHEVCTAEADALADRLRREADRVARRARLEADREAAQRRQALLEGQEAERVALGGRQRSAWGALWADGPLKPVSPREMLAALQIVDQVVAEARGIEALARRHTATRDRARHHLQALDTARATLPFDGAHAGGGAPTEPDAAWLAGAIRQAEALCAECRQADTERARLRTRLDEEQSQRSSARAELERAEAALTRWQGAWAEVVGPLGLPERALPAQVDAVLEALDAGFRHEEEAHTYKVRVRAIEKDERHLKADLSAVVETLVPDRGEESPRVLIPWLAQRADEIRHRQDRRASLGEQIEAMDREVRGLEADLETHQARLAGFCAMAGVEAAHWLPAIERGSSALATLDEAQARVEEGLRVLSGGAGVEALITEVETCDPDALEAERASLEVAVESAEQALKRTDESLGHIRARMEAADGGGKAAEAHEAGEAMAERVRARCAAYARVRLQATLLRMEIEAHRARTQGPVLARAGAVFHDLTGGSFEGLGVDYDARGTPFLLGRRPDGRRVGVEGMSEGTRDQLYLALRLAFLERGLDAGPAIPFVVDDILVHFDDTRSSAALQVLARLAQRTQVLFFTHHHHLVEVAREALGPDGVATLHLERSPGARLVAG